jgi:hypothetical protein
MICDQRKTYIEETLTEFNEQQHIIKFTIEKELHNSINFLDLSTHRRKKELKFSIFRKPTQTDTIMSNDSYHPHEYKTSSINYLVNRLNTYPVSKEVKEKELNIKHVT